MALHNYKLYAKMPAGVLERGHVMRTFVIAGLASLLLATPALAQPRPAPDPAAGARSLLRPEQQNPTTDKMALMLDFMELTLPYVDYQVVHYKDARTGEELGTAKRLGLRITFRNAQGDYIGKAERRSQAKTAYFDSEGNFLGIRVYQLQTAIKKNVVVRPGDAARQRPPDE